MADPKPNQHPITPESVGIGPMEGGASLVLMGKGNGVSATSDE